MTERVVRQLHYDYAAPLDVVVLVSTSPDPDAGHTKLRLRAYTYYFGSEDAVVSESTHTVAGVVDLKRAVVKFVEDLVGYRH